MLSPSHGMAAILKNSSDFLVAGHSVPKDGPTEFHSEWGGRSLNPTCSHVNNTN